MADTWEQTCCGKGNAGRLDFHNSCCTESKGVGRGGRPEFCSWKASDVCSLKLLADRQGGLWQENLQKLACCKLH
jgi:hypothetical protein